VGRASQEQPPPRPARYKGAGWLQAHLLQAWRLLSHVEKWALGHALKSFVANSDERLLPKRGSFFGPFASLQANHNNKTIIIAKKEDLMWFLVAFSFSSFFGFRFWVLWVEWEARDPPFTTPLRKGLLVHTPVGPRAHSPVYKVVVGGGLALV